MKTFYKISEISKLYDIGLDSLRYYERLGILKPKRLSNNYRVYSLDDIWRLNMIKELRMLDFSMNDIKIYLENRSIKTTLKLLNDEIEYINNKISDLEKTKNILSARYDEINNSAKNVNIDCVTEKFYDDRKYILLDKYDAKEEEMDFMVKQLQHKREKYLNTDDIKEKLFILGNSVLGATISYDDYIDDITNTYKGVIMLLDKDEEVYQGVISSGSYLNYSYKGEYSGTWMGIQKIKDYAKQNNLFLEGDALELWDIDVHETNNVNEYITSVQIKIKENI